MGETCMIDMLSIDRSVMSLLEGRLSSAAVAADVDTNFKVFNVSHSSAAWCQKQGRGTVLVKKAPSM